MSVGHGDQQTRSKNPFGTHFSISFMTHKAKDDRYRASTSTEERTACDKSR